MKLHPSDITLLKNIARAQSQGHDGLAAKGDTYQHCKQLEDVGLIEYVSECEVVDDDGHMTGETCACFALANDGRTLLADLG
jgi:hypothetical protein